MSCAARCSLTWRSMSTACARSTGSSTTRAIAPSANTWPMYSSCEMLSRKHQPANRCRPQWFVARSAPDASATSAQPAVSIRTHLLPRFSGLGTYIIGSVGHARPVTPGGINWRVNRPGTPVMSIRNRSPASSVASASRAAGSLVTAYRYAWLAITSALNSPSFSPLHHASTSRHVALSGSVPGFVTTSTTHGICGCACSPMARASYAAAFCASDSAVARVSTGHRDHCGSPYRHGSTHASASHSLPSAAHAASSHAGTGSGSEVHAARTSIGASQRMRGPYARSASLDVSAR